MAYSNSRYGDDSLALIKQSNADNTSSKPNCFHPSLNFIVGNFDDGAVHYLDFKIIDNETDIYYKDTRTVQYMHFSSYTHWNIKTGWIKALYNRAKNMQSSEIIRLSNQKNFVIHFIERIPKICQ